MKGLVGRLLVVVLALAALVAAGCGGNDDNKGNTNASGGNGGAATSTSAQDVAITGPEPPVDGGPALDVARSLEFLSTPAPRRERVSLS